MIIKSYFAMHLRGTDFRALYFIFKRTMTHISSITQQNYSVVNIHVEHEYS